MTKLEDAPISKPSIEIDDDQMEDEKLP